MIFPKPQLPTYSLLLETPARRRVLIRAFRGTVEVATSYLGAKEVRKIVTEVTRAPRGKRSQLDRNRQLLREYDAESANGLPVNILDLARRLYEERKGAFGASPSAIEKHLRRLLREREKQYTAASDATREWFRMIEKGLGYRPTSVLGSDK